MSLLGTVLAPSWLHPKGGPRSLHTGGGHRLPPALLTEVVHMHTKSLYSDSQTQEMLGKNVVGFGEPTPGHVIRIPPRFTRTRPSCPLLVVWNCSS